MKILSTAFLIFFLFTQCQENQKGNSTEIDNHNDQENLFHTKNVVFKDQFIEGETIYHYLTNPNVYDIAVLYYYGDLEISQSETSIALIDSCINHKGALRPFYYKCFESMCANADSSIAEMMGKKSIELLQVQTPYVIKKLNEGSPDFFTGLIANVMYKETNWEENVNELFIELHTNLEAQDPTLRQELDLFIVGLKNDIEHMIKRL